MSPRAVEWRVKRIPFRPFQIICMDGEVYVILHPEQVIVDGNELVFPLPASDPSVRAQDGITVSLLHVVRLEPLPPERR